jgi:hypothetical protein
MNNPYDRPLHLEKWNTALDECAFQRFPDGENPAKPDTGIILLPPETSRAEFEDIFGQIECEFGAELGQPDREGVKLNPYGHYDVKWSRGELVLALEAHFSGGRWLIITRAGNPEMFRSGQIKSFEIKEDSHV